MTQTHSSTRVRILSGMLTVAVGVFGGQLLLTSHSTVNAALRPVVPKTQTVQKKAPVRKATKVRVLKKTSKRMVRQRAGSGGVAEKGRTVDPTLYEKPRCGDKLILLEEECDDGNTVSGDGCSSACKVETGFSCTKSQPSACASYCGDGAIASNEQCDDADTENGDGCSASCKQEIFYRCSGSPSVCKIPALCGNAVVEEGETCDDDNTSPNDGCSATCQTE